MKKNKLKWVVEFTVDDSWVADGFDLTDERALSMLGTALPFAFEYEIGAKVIKSPTARAKISRQ